MGEIVEPQVEPHLETQERKAHGNSMATPRKNDKLTLEQTSPKNQREYSQGLQADRAQMNPHKIKRHHRTSTHKADGNDDERVLPNERRRIEVGKKEKPDSA